MKKMKNAICLSLCVIIALAMLTGCGPGANTTSQQKAPAEQTPASTDKPASTAENSGQVTLMTIDTTFGQKFTDYIAKAETATGIKINAIACPTDPNDRQAKITTILSSGDNSVDIITVNDEMISAFKHTGFLEPLQSDVMTPEIVKFFPKDYVKDMIMVGDNIYSVPMFMEILVMWVNQKILDKVGMKAPTNQEEFTKFVKAATGNGVYGYGGAWEKTYVFNEIGTFVNLFGGDYFDWTNPKSRAAVKFLYDMAKEGVTPKAQLADIYDPMMQKFFDGKYGIILMYSGAMQTFIDSGKYGPDGVHIIPMPKFETSSAYMATWQYVLNKASANKEAAKKFLKYAATPQGELDYFEMSKRLPARSDVLNDPNFKAEGLEDIKGYLANTTLRGRPMVPQTMEFISSMGSLFQQYVSDEITLDEFCQNAQKEVEKYKK
jgi:multiple sugar transport system substrate-binding protein